MGVNIVFIQKIVGCFYLEHGRYFLGIEKSSMSSAASADDDWKLQTISVASLLSQCSGIDLNRTDGKLAQNACPSFPLFVCVSVCQSVCPSVRLFRRGFILSVHSNDPLWRRWADVSVKDCQNAKMRVFHSRQQTCNEQIIKNFASTQIASMDRSDL